MKKYKVDVCLTDKDNIEFFELSKIEAEALLTKLIDACSNNTICIYLGQAIISKNIKTFNLMDHHCNSVSYTIGVWNKVTINNE